MSKPIKINIDNAKITQINIDVSQSFPEVTVKIDLCAGEKVISTFVGATDCWQDERKFNLSPSVAEQIGKIAKSLERTVTKLCQEQIKELPKPQDLPS